MLHRSSVVAEATAAAWQWTYGFMLLSGRQLLLAAKQRLESPILPYKSTSTELEKLVLFERYNCLCNNCKFHKTPFDLSILVSNVKQYSQHPVGTSGNDFWIELN